MVKDPPELTDVSSDASNVDFFTGNKKTFLFFVLPLLMYDLHLRIIKLLFSCYAIRRGLYPRGIIPPVT